MLFGWLTIPAALVLSGIIEPAFLIGAIATIFTNKASDKPRKRSRWLKFGTYFAIVHTVLVFAALGHPWFTSLMILIAGGGAMELFVVSQKKFRERTDLPVILLAAIIYTGLSLALLTCPFVLPPAEIVFVYLTIAMLDAYSQIIGQLIGRHKLAPQVSPNKTVEGALGGAAAAILTAVLCRSLIGCGTTGAFLLGASLACAGIAGDLLASWYKRYCGIVDYSTVLPGQGGIIDRFNSLLAALPVYYLIRLWQC